MSWLRLSRRGRADPEPMDQARERMVRQQIVARGLTDPELVRAFRAVPRHHFISSPSAYADEALPLAEGQTISQPYVVALMTDAARPPRGWRGARALEVGTGSGYQAAILAELGASVVSIERHPDLSDEAGRSLTAAGYGDVRLVVGDGTAGWPEGAPYDAIVVTAAGPSIPTPLLEQLAVDGGRLVMPVGSRSHQDLAVVERRGADFVTQRRGPVVFVPLIGAHGFEE